MMHPCHVAFDPLVGQGRTWRFCKNPYLHPCMQTWAFSWRSTTSQFWSSIPLEWVSLRCQGRVRTSMYTSFLLPLTIWDFLLPHVWQVWWLWSSSHLPGLLEYHLPLLVQGSTRGYLRELQYMFLTYPLGRPVLQSGVPGFNDLGKVGFEEDVISYCNRIPFCQLVDYSLCFGVKR